MLRRPNAHHLLSPQPPVQIPPKNKPFIFEPSPQKVIPKSPKQYYCADKQQNYTPLPKQEPIKGQHSLAKLMAQYQNGTLKGNYCLKLQKDNYTVAMVSLKTQPIFMENNQQFTSPTGNYGRALFQKDEIEHNNFRKINKQNSHTPEQTIEPQKESCRRRLFSAYGQNDAQRHTARNQEDLVFQVKKGKMPKLSSLAQTFTNQPHKEPELQAGQKHETKPAQDPKANPFVTPIKQKWSEAQYEGNECYQSSQLSNQKMIRESLEDLEDKFLNLDSASEHSKIASELKTLKSNILAAIVEKSGRAQHPEFIEGIKSIIEKHIDQYTRNILQERTQSNISYKNSDHRHNNMKSPDRLAKENNSMLIFSFDGASAIMHDPPSPDIIEGKNSGEKNPAINILDVGSDIKTDNDNNYIDKTSKELIVLPGDLLSQQFAQTVVKEGIMNDGAVIGKIQVPAIQFSREVYDELEYTSNDSKESS